jgi:hypothetical protein
MLFNPIGMVTLEVDHEYNAELFWDTLKQEFPLVDEQFRKGRGRAMVSRDEWDSIQRIEGFAGGPAYAPTALIRIS